MMEEELLFSLVLLGPSISCDYDAFYNNVDNFPHHPFIQQCYYRSLDENDNEVLLSNLVFQPPEEELADPSYWSGWLSEQQIDPVLSHSLSFSHFGVGFWLYNENSESNDLSAIIQDYGIRLSVGLGRVEAGRPRIRLDYRWHEDYSGDVIMRFDLPF